MNLSEEEINRYARHIVLPQIGGAGQQLLKQSIVSVIGAGGLGSPAIEYLAAAGIGCLRIIDDDIVSLSNLQRQIIHRNSDCGIPKSLSAKRFVEELNPHVAVTAHVTRLTQDNGDELLRGSDLVLEGSDNFATRYLTADLCKVLRIPLITAAVGRFDGSITTLKPYEMNSLGTPFPEYRDIFPEAASNKDQPTCEEAGIVGALTGIMGSLQALEAIKEITGAGESLAGRLMLFDGATFRWEEIAL